MHQNLQAFLVLFGYEIASMPIIPILVT